jgi:ubiquinone/menaquinone biosynthesis C-methylase UbiE
MRIGRKAYQWWYDHVACRYYDLLVRWCFAPGGGESRVREQLLRPVSFGASDRILDMCCGTGNGTLAIASAGGGKAEVVGADLSLGQVRRAEAKSRSEKCRFVVGDATAAAFRDGCFDKVFITHALHEMPRAARLGALREARRVLKREGELIVLELDQPESLFLRILVGFWCFYWLPLNFETPTRRDMFRHGLVNEVREAGFHSTSRTSAAHGALQTVSGRK